MDARADEAEQRLRRLLKDNDLPEPDAVEHHPGELLVLWREQKLAVVVELDAPARRRPHE